MRSIQTKWAPGGSAWHRWAHIRAPGTVLADGFGGDWEAYLSKLEKATPRVRALGITDYCCVSTYREVLKFKQEGRLPEVEFLFPNVELGLDLRTDRSKGINIQLLFSPEDPDHLALIERVLNRLYCDTRGIVLLLLYLAIDKSDRRPLLIDQPEENLDPKSVFDDLVPPFREARKRRQIIIVTHNANLVVNTDADQVIVASCEPAESGQLHQSITPLARSRTRKSGPRSAISFKERTGVPGTVASLSFGLGEDAGRRAGSGS